MAAPDTRFLPKSLKQTGSHELEIEWKDGHISHYPTRYLRANCSCAHCVHEWTGRRQVKEADISKDVHPLQIEGVGRYGINITWSDGHKTGIYSFEQLRNLCPSQKT